MDKSTTIRIGFNAERNLIYFVYNNSNSQLFKKVQSVFKTFFEEEVKKSNDRDFPDMGGVIDKYATCAYSLGNVEDNRLYVANKRADAIADDLKKDTDFNGHTVYKIWNQEKIELGSVQKKDKC